VEDPLALDPKTRQLIAEAVRREMEELRNLHRQQSTALNTLSADMDTHIRAMDERTTILERRADHQDLQFDRLRTDFRAQQVVLQDTVRASTEEVKDQLRELSAFIRGQHWPPPSSQHPPRSPSGSQGEAERDEKATGTEERKRGEGRGEPK
jgi:hypothetical protein